MSERSSYSANLELEATAKGDNVASWMKPAPKRAAKQAPRGPNPGFWLILAIAAVSAYLLSHWAN